MYTFYSSLFIGKVTIFEKFFTFLHVQPCNDSLVDYMLYKSTSWVYNKCNRQYKYK